MTGLPEGHTAARMLPDVTVTATDGRVVALADYRHRKHLVLIVLPDPLPRSGIPLLGALSPRYAEFVGENAEVLAVFPASTAFPGHPSAPAGYPFPVLEDPDGALSGALSDRLAPGIRALTVHVADRYGEIFRSIGVAEGEPFPLEEVLSWLRFLERLCPE